MTCADDEDPRIAEVRDVLDRVTDPELDESVTSLGFVSRITIDAADRVGIGLRLPTYWCSANFAWIMAEDMRDAVAALPWTHGVSVTLDEHMFADTINDALDGGRSFRDAFGAEADSASLDAVRASFARKAFGRRQLAVIEALLAENRDAAAILALRVAELAALPPTREISRYLEKRAVAGPFTAADLAFPDPSGAPIAAERLGVHLSALRSIVVNMEFNGALCRGLLSARYCEPDTVPAARAGAPELIDFIRNARHAA